MGNRISRVTTRTGDDGTTGLATGDRVPKHHHRIAAMGDIDELNCQLGVLLTLDLPGELREPLQRLQHVLFNLGGELAMPGTVLVGEDQVTWLEGRVESLNQGLPPLKEFVLPGGNPPAAQAHLARAVARRAERGLWKLAAQEPLGGAALRFTNRLSDFLFVAARILARAGGGQEVTWKRELP
jgi:cob(I)alamin adenosyltransferase